jgi:hypothetical protein
MDETIVLGFLILASITVFIISLYIVIPTLMTGNKIEIEEKRKKELKSLTLSKEKIKNEETLGTELNKA